MSFNRRPKRVLPVFSATITAMGNHRAAIINRKTWLQNESVLFFLNVLH